MTSKLKLLPTTPGKKKATLTDVKAANTPGGNGNFVSFATRDLNTITGDTDIVSLSSNQFTLSPGTYLLWGSGSAYKVNSHKVQLYDVTNTAIITNGTSSKAGTADNNSRRSYFAAHVTISSETTYELRHRQASTGASTNLGIQSNLGQDEVYSIVNIIQLEE